MGVPGAAEFVTWSDLLRDCISSISQDYFCAGWQAEIEFLIWHLVSGNPTLPASFERWNLEGLSAGTRADLRFLSDRAGGWHTFESFVETDDWISSYKTWLGEQRFEPTSGNR